MFSSQFIPIDHKVNIAYEEAATLDLKDEVLIDSYHLKTYGENVVNYNRDIEAFHLPEDT